ncbi:ABC transporter permease [Bacillus sp. RAR_GA_16]|uniref:ABC transporter permease n=1 Tax=Bacillus sp. RAR_GA_16 TaxID=2876774 RepID=UPI001CCE6604|nr:ABC transporter permease [Bacillus sp. RAR_GA_16]MCA0172799.1 ABC transporter permease [Bacillus sp. RAR_GA_16]
MLKKLLNDWRNNKDLLYHLTVSELKSNTARTYLGTLWWIVDPILYMAIYYFLVGIVLNRGGDDYAVYLFTGLIPLKWATACMVDATTAISSKARILQQVYVPKLTFILVRLGVNTFKFLVSSVIMVLFLYFSGVELTVNALNFFILIVFNLLLLLPIMIIMAHIGVYLKDIKNMMQYISRTLLYLSPVLFRMESVPANIRDLLYLNPFTDFLVSYRNIFLYQGQPLWDNLFIILGLSLVLLFIGLRILNKYDKQYAKVI